MRILVTGGTGFVGLALTRHLRGLGHAVEMAAPGPAPDWAQAALGSDARVHPLDVRDGGAVRALMRELRPELVIHGAAATPDAAREAAGDAAEIVDINIGGTATVIEAAAASGAAQVIALSSVAVYGRTLDDCDMLTEDMPPRPQILYAITKAAAETLALRLGAVHAIPVLTPRVGVLWGPWEHRTGLRATPSPVFHMMEQARRGRDIRLPFAATAPLCHIALFCDMLTAAIDAGPVGGIVNMGAERSLDLLQVARAIAARFGVAACIDAEGANVPFFAVNRPPMRLDRLRQMTGQTFADTPLEHLLDGYAGWLDGLAADGPCPRG